MASFVQFPDPTVTSPTSTSIFPVAAIQPKPEPADEESLIAPPGIPAPLGVPTLGTPLAVQFPNLARESRPGTSADGANVYDEQNQTTQTFTYAFSGDQNEVVENNEARDIVPVEENPGNQIIFFDQGQHRERSNELVRVPNLSREDQVYYRGIVRKTRMLYDAIRIHLADERRGDLKAAKVMRSCGLWLFTDKRIIGAIPGIEIGDVFCYRMELSVVGLHGYSQAGIDFVAASMSPNGEPLATSIVARYKVNIDEVNMITYSGTGGQDKHSKQIAHQKLEGGNLALERSMHYGIDVRVIRGHEHKASPNGIFYIYDGLYRVTEYWSEIDTAGYRVYKYRLVRLQNQPKMSREDLLLAESLKTKPLVRTRGNACLDISMGRENVPITLFNDIDGNHEPLEHDYLVKSSFPLNVCQYGNGCQCLAGCSVNCSCVGKNGGQFAYDRDGILIQGKPLIFECGPSCSCLPSCRNRVTQRGVRHRLEVFRSGTGWGVRSLDYILAGSFLCEYAGVVLTKEQAQVLSMVGDNLVYPRRFTESWKEWGDLSQVSPNYVQPSVPEIPPLDFALDVSTLRNVASYISHSRSPNVMVQFVLYDHNNLEFPRLMLFATESIPPFRELTLDYGGGS